MRWSRIGVCMFCCCLWCFGLHCGRISNGRASDSFKRYDSSLGIWMSEFKGIDNFVNLVAGVNKEQFWQAFRNTFVINAYSLVFGFPVPIILAVLFSEIGNGFVRKATQTATYLPHFLSEVTITGITIMLVYSGVHSTGVLAACFRIWDGWRKGCPCCPRPTISGLCT